MFNIVNFEYIYILIREVKTVYFLYENYANQRAWNLTQLVF